MHQRFNGIFAFTLILAIALTGLGQQPAGSTRADNLKPGERRSDTPKKVVKVEDIEKDIAEALTVIERNYGGTKELNYNDVMKASIDSMLHTLDPHSNYFDAKEYEEFRTDQS